MLEADNATLEKAIGKVDIGALDAGDQQKFDAFAEGIAGHACRP